MKCAKYGPEITVCQLGKDEETKMIGRTKNKNKNKIGLIDHAWYMSPGSLTSLTCFMAQ